MKNKPSNEELLKTIYEVPDEFKPNRQMSNINPYNSETEPASHKWFNEKLIKEKVVEPMSETKILFHECWSKAMASHEYIHADWVKLEKLLKIK